MRDSWLFTQSLPPERTVPVYEGKRFGSGHSSPLPGLCPDEKSLALWPWSPLRLGRVRPYNLRARVATCGSNCHLSLANRSLSAARNRRIPTTAELGPDSSLSGADGPTRSKFLASNGAGERNGSCGPHLTRFVAARTNNRSPPNLRRTRSTSARPERPDTYAP